MAEKIKEKHIQIEESATASLLNCIDLSSPDVQSSVTLLKQACLDCGFFYVINHGIGEELMDEVFSQSKRFFELPKEEKMKLLRNEKNRGYTPLFDESLDPGNQIHGDYKEGYYIGIELPEDQSDAQKPFYGPNRWPSEDILPRWRETMEKYHQVALEVVRSVSRLIALALGLNVDFFNQPEMLGKPIATLRLLHYEGRTSEPANGIFGAGAHSDFGLVTLLATDDNYGLQICKDKNAKPQIWEYVPPLKGAFVINLGDMLERWSNCLFRCCIIASRSVYPVEQYMSFVYYLLALKFQFKQANGLFLHSFDRDITFPCYPCIAFFVEPSHDCIVECLPTCQSEKNPAKFPPIKCQDYVLQRYKDTHADLSSYK